MSANNSVQEPKPGVRGWRAFFLVFGCGTLAAFVAMGSIIGLARFIFAGVSAESEPIGTFSRAPRESTKAGVLDVCGKGVESSGMLSNPVRKDADEPPVDSATASPSERPRTVRDACAWKVVGADGSNQTLTLDYRAVMSDSGDKSKLEIAESDIRDKKMDIARDLDRIVDDSQPRGMSTDEAYSVFGTSSDDPDVLTYVMIGRVKSAVFTVRLEGASPQDGNLEEKKNSYSGMVRRVMPYIKSDFERIVPD